MVSPIILDGAFKNLRIKNPKGVGVDDKLKTAYLQLRDYCKWFGCSTPPTLFTFNLIGQPSQSKYPSLLGIVKAAHMLGTLRKTVASVG